MILFYSNQSENGKRSYAKKRKPVVQQTGPFNKVCSRLNNFITFIGNTLNSDKCLFKHDPVVTHYIMSNVPFLHLWILFQFFH